MRTEDGPHGFATAHAEDIDVLAGRVIAASLRRTAVRDEDGPSRRGGVYGLRIDGTFYEDTRKAEKIEVDG